MGVILSIFTEPASNDDSSQQPEEPDGYTRWWVQVETISDSKPFTREEIRMHQRVLSNFWAPNVSSVFEPVENGNYCVQGHEDVLQYMLDNQLQLEAQLGRRVTLKQANGQTHV
jgi:hypothetical protein